MLALMHSSIWNAELQCFLCWCQGDCSTDDIYSDYPGPLRGLMADACDVGFTKQTIPLEYAKDGSTPESWSTIDKVS